MWPIFLSRRPTGGSSVYDVSPDSASSSDNGNIARLSNSELLERLVASSEKNAEYFANVAASQPVSIDELIERAALLNTRGAASAAAAVTSEDAAATTASTCAATAAPSATGPRGNNSSLASGRTVTPARAGDAAPTTVAGAAEGRPEKNTVEKIILCRVDTKQA